MPIKVVALFTAKPGKTDELKEVLLGLIAPTHQEEGCIYYELHQDLDSGEFAMLEEWESIEALAAHFETPHIQDALSKFESLIDNLDVRKYQLVS